MYLPPHFREDRLPVLHQAIREARLASLITLGDGGLCASHIPMLLAPEAGTLGTLYGHVARANPQWHDRIAEVEALAIFTGPDAYVSPSWYATKRDSGRVVPTWNYVVVHAFGRLETFEDRSRLRDLVTRLTDAHEAHRPDRWRVSDAPAAFVRRQLAGIIGLELRISRIEGKWKLSQNRPANDRAGVTAALSASPAPNDRAVAALMRERGDEAPD